VKKLEAMGHTVNVAEQPWGNLQTVAWDKAGNALEGGTDPRNPVGKVDVMPTPSK
jgi:gamma-glutamyltranspeptidase/glutathione hydrolase